MSLLYNESLEFADEGHIYTVWGVAVPSATQILTVLTGDLSHIPAYYALKGKAVHLATELDDLGDLEESSVAGEIAPYLVAWRKFKNEHRWVGHEVEAKGYNASLWYAGTIDRLGTLDGRPMVLDIKSGKPQKSHRIQLAAYVGLLREHADDYGRVAVYLRNDGTYDLREHADDDDFLVWAAALKVWRWKEGKRAKNNANELGGMRGDG